MKTENELKEITLPTSSDWVERVKEKAINNATQYGSCTQSILSAFMEEFGIDDPLLFSAAGAMHIGMLTSLTCGIQSAAMMVLGLMMGRERLEQGRDAMAPIMGPGQELIRRINSRIGGHSCRELSGTDFTDLEQAIAFKQSEDFEKCLFRMRDGAEEIALFLKELDEKGELFSI